MVGIIGQMSLGPAPNPEHCSLVGWGTSWHDPALTWDMLPLPKDSGPRRAMCHNPQLCSLPRLHEAAKSFLLVEGAGCPSHCPGSWPAAVLTWPGGTGQALVHAPKEPHAATAVLQLG